MRILVLTEDKALRLFSFEIKRTFDRSNYRESFFQAVSNSSRANEGYLVAAPIKQDDDLIAELERRSTSFGIGIIQLDLEDPDSSEVIFPGPPESNLDFARFVQNVKIDFQSKKIHPSEYNRVPDDIDSVVRNLLSK